MADLEKNLIGTASNTGRHRSAERMALGAIAACFILSRVLAWSLGVRFATSEVEYFWQFLDTGLLKHQLWTSVLYLHSQPPLMNLAYGILIQPFPVHWPLVAYSLNLVIGLLAYAAMHAIMVRNNVSSPIALLVVILAMCNPSAVIFEAEPFYTHTVFCLLIFAVFLFQSYIKQPSLRIGAAFLGMLTTLALWRSSYQLVWYGLCALWLMKKTPPQLFRKMVLLACVFGSIVGSLYVKNEILFGFFNSSSGSGMSLAKTWAGTPKVVKLVQEGKLSPISSIPSFEPMDHYLPVISLPRKRGLKAVDAVFKDNGSINFDNIGYPEVSRLYSRDYWKLLRLSPMTIAHQVSMGWLDYFRPNSAWISAFDAANQSALESADRPYRFFFCYGASRALDSSDSGDSPDSTEHKLFRRLASVCWGMVLVYVVLALFLASRAFQRLVVRGNRAQRQVLLFLISNVAYSAILCNTVEVGENMRFRYETQGLAVIAATIIGWRVLNSLLNSAKPRENMKSKSSGAPERMAAL